MIKPCSDDGETVITIVGHVCIDENQTAEGAVRRTAGSPAVYMAGQFAGCRNASTTIVAAHGPDFLAVAPDITLLDPADRVRTLLYRNSFEQGEGDIPLRVQQCFFADDSAPAALGPAAGVQLAGSQLVIIAPLVDNLSADYLDEVFASLSPGTLTVLLPQGFMRKVGADHRVRQCDFVDAERILPHVDIVVFSDEDHPDALRLASDWSTRFPRTNAVVTQNMRGATLFENGRAQSVSATAVSRTDSFSTIGAGDVFGAHLALDYYFDRNLPAAVAQANTAAAVFLEAANQNALA